MSFVCGGVYVYMGVVCIFASKPYPSMNPDDKTKGPCIMVGTMRRRSAAWDSEPHRLLVHAVQRA